MTDLNKHKEQALRMLTLVEPHECSYLPDQKSNSIFIDSETQPSWQQYCQLSHMGFRRSGNHYYRPHCPACEACKSCRVRALDINLKKKRFKRILNKSRQFNTALAPANYSQEHYDLYKKYINARHKDGDMYPPSIDQYKSFLTSVTEYSQFFEIRDQNNKLLASTAADFLNDGISAIYTYYDPDFECLSPGTLAVLLLCELARKNHYEYVYLGYWVKNSRKMHYKAQYQPLEIFNGDNWQLLREEF